MGFTKQTNKQTKIITMRWVLPNKQTNKNNNNEDKVVAHRRS
jgi:hypothetical protein